MILYPAALTEAAHQAHAAGDPAAAEAALRLALGHGALDAHALYFIGHLAYLQGRLDDACWFLTLAVGQDPRHARAHNDLGETLRALGRTEAAIVHLEQAVALEPTLAHAHGNLAVSLLALGRDQQALDQARLSLAQSTDTATAHCDLASVLGRLGRPREALPHYRQAGALRPDDPRPRYFAALMRLTLGEMPDAWAEHDLRLHLPQGTDGGIRPSGPRWNGEPVPPGTRILLHAEQGFGDTIQFARYASLVAARGAIAVLDTQAGLGRLLATVPGVASAHERGTPVPACEMHCPLMSLPAAFATTESTIPATVPYVTPPAADRTRCQARLAAHPRPRVGLAWSGRPTHAADRERSIPLRTLAPLLNAAPVSWIGLQRDLRDADAEVLATLPSLTNLGALTTDFADTAALLAELDLVIGVDTSVVHLAGALARPTWVLLPYAADWRWMQDRTDSPWYPTMRLFRQPARHDWASVLDQLAAALRIFADTPPCR